MTPIEEVIKSAWIAEIGEEKYNICVPYIGAFGWLRIFVNTPSTVVMHTRNNENNFESKVVETHNAYFTFSRPKTLLTYENNNS